MRIKRCLLPRSFALVSMNCFWYSALINGKVRVDVVLQAVLRIGSKAGAAVASPQREYELTFKWRGTVNKCRNELKRYFRLIERQHVATIAHHHEV